jgi:hypothetical protein
MKKIINHGYSLFIIGFMVIQLLSGCFKDQVAFQIEIQNVLLNPGNANECWTLTTRSDTATINYYLKYYTFRYKFGNVNFNNVIDDGVIYYTNPVSNSVKLTGDFFDEYKIDNDINCSTGLDSSEDTHLFFSPDDYPDFGRIENHKYSRGTMNISISDFQNPSVKDSSFGYYEELYFESTGRFIKKIYPDTGCRYIEITGNWMFRTPFANSAGLGLTTEIILNYDLAPLVGIAPKGNIYTLNLNQINGKNGLVIEQRRFEEDSRFFKRRSHYTKVVDHIYYTSNLDVINYSNEFVVRGMVKNTWTKNCTAWGTPKDLYEIYDPLDLSKVKTTTLRSAYEVKPIRCSGTIINTGCPKFCTLDICGTFNASIFDSDDGTLISTHISDMSITSDSTVLTITNFANTGQPLNIKMPDYCWNSCYNYNGFQTVLNGVSILFVTFKKGTYQNKDMIYVECQINGEQHLIHYEL